ncbi:DUF305 domain-containing protein [Streptosporangium saharense]|uniref:DUF305 domain-containing protein n=1 Tax=Streptosporangium saharense TaxID=1706840 RepID=UPI0036BF5232
MARGLTPLGGLLLVAAVLCGRAFLTLMIQHHEGAVAMAKQERAGGAHEPARRMAADIVSGQSAEIATMRRLLR